MLSGALVLAAVAFALFPLIRETWQAFALNLLVGVATGAFWPSQSTLLSSLTPPGRRHAAFAQQRMTMNVGFALGALVAGAIARTAHPSTFTFLFLLNAVTFLVFVVVLQFVPSTRHREERREPGRYADVARNRVFISYVFLNVILIGAGIAVMSELLPPFAKNTAHVSEPAIGVIWFVFSAVVALGAASGGEARRRQAAAARPGIDGCRLGRSVPRGARRGRLVHGHIRLRSSSAVAVGVFALAECLHGAIYAPLVVDLAEPQLLGRYMAFSSSSWQIGFFVGPAIGGFVLQHQPLALWPAAAADLRARLRLCPRARTTDSRAPAPHAARGFPRRRPGYHGEHGASDRRAPQYRCPACPASGGRGLTVRGGGRTAPGTTRR